MIISCPACGTRYVVPETAIGADGRTVRCAKCKHSWFQDPKPLDLTERVDPPEEGEQAAPPPPPPPPPSPPPPAPPPKAETIEEDGDAAPSISHWRTEDRPETAAAAAGGVGVGSRSTAKAEEEPAGAEPQEEPEVDPPIEETFDNASDPLAGESGEDGYADNADYDFDEGYDEDEGSRFDYSPPFSRRRNPLKMWTLAAAIFALLASGTVLAVNYYGLPDWFPVQRPTFGIGQSDLELDFPASQQRKEALESGEEIFRVRGAIRNIGQQSVTVPSLLIVFRDERERIVGDWVVVPAKRELAPGESLNVTEAIADIPPAAKAAYIGWAPN